MKRSIDETNFYTATDEMAEGSSKAKVMLVERNIQPNGVALVNPTAIAKKSYNDSVELMEGVVNAGTFIQANTRNKLDMIGRQMKHLQELMGEVFMETEMHVELHSAACNFVKKPGHVYHLYERPSGQKYFSMLSPEEWQNHPHQFIGSYKLEADQSWTPADKEHTRYEGLTHLKEIFQMSGMKAIINPNR